MDEVIETVHTQRQVNALKSFLSYIDKYYFSALFQIAEE